MNQSEVQKLSPGVYEIFWKSGGSSLAAVGSCRDGTRWLAPCNWVNSEGRPFEAVHEQWHQVEKVRLIETKLQISEPVINHKKDYSKDVIESKNYLIAKAQEFGQPCFLLASLILHNPDFSLWSGSSKPEQHHYGDGGLIIHTAEVVRLCLEVNQSMNAKVNDELLYLAALYHDVGKMWDYEQDIVYDMLDSANKFGMNVGKSTGGWSSTEHKYKIHHISRSALVWNLNAQNYYSSSQIDVVTHAILAHHGFREWGSPVEPRSKMAWILHLCDNLSARLDSEEQYA
jgi:putative nucleotidyltransferase with HDIG domain